MIAPDNSIAPVQHQLILVFHGVIFPSIVSAIAKHILQVLLVLSGASAIILAP